MGFAQSTGAAAPQQQLTPAQRQKERLDKFMEALEKRQDNLSTLLSDSAIDPDRFLAVARRALMLDPDLLACTTDSLMRAFMNAATDGLLPDKRQGAIVAYNDRKRGVKDAQWQPMYQGLLRVAYESGNFTSIEARVVYEGDDFDYELGDEPFIRHKPKSRPAGMPRPPIIAAYAVAKTTNGGIFREVFEGDDIRKVNAVSRATSGPGKDWPEEMARKGPLRRLWKFLPRSPAMDRIADHDDDNYDLSQLDEPANDLSHRRLAPGFQPAALTHQPGEVFDLPMGQADGAEAEFVEAGGFHTPVQAAAKALDDDDLPSGLRGAPSEVEDGYEREDDGGDYEPGEIDPETWARSLINDDGTIIATLGDIHAIFHNQEACARFERLKAESPTIARELEAALRGREKALKSRETAR